MNLDEDRVMEFWRFMIERELIRQRRLLGLPRERWTQDKIFQEFSFTNVKRIHDRTTTLLWQEFYGEGQDVRHPEPIALLNAAIFRYLGTIEAARAIGWSTDWDRERFVTKIGARMAVGETTFTSAYIIPNCGSTAPKHEIVAEIIDGIWSATTHSPETQLVLDTDSWQIACERLCRCFGVGSFMAKEVLLDYVLATGWVPEDWDAWTPVGPGGRRGAGYVLNGEVRGVGEDQALDVIRELYHGRHRMWPITYRLEPTTLEQVDFPHLDLTDVQFQLCEFAKYKKAQLGYGRPKRKFRPTIDSITQKRS